MQNGSCLKCSAETVYYSDESYPKSGLKTDSGYPYLSIYKDKKWIPGIHHSQMVCYVC